MLGAMRQLQKGRKTEQLHVVHDTHGKLWHPGGKPVYLISLLHHLFLYPPLCFLISAHPSIQGFCLFHFLSAICSKCSLCNFYPLPHLNLDHFLLQLLHCNHRKAGKDVIVSSVLFIKASPSQLQFPGLANELRAPQCNAKIYSVTPQIMDRRTSRMLFKPYFTSIHFLLKNLLNDLYFFFSSYPAVARLDRAVIILRSARSPFANEHFK